MKVGMLGLLAGAGLAWFAWDTYKKANAKLMAADLATAQAGADLAAAELQQAGALALAALEEASEEEGELEMDADDTAPLIPFFPVPVGQSTSSQVFQIVPRF